MSKYIPLSKGKIATVDNKDYEYLNQFKWQFKIGRGKTTGYAARTEYLGKVDGKYKTRTVLMHKEIMCSPDHDIDHRDGDGLNNQRSNLRLATPSQNAMNKGKQTFKKGRPSSKYKGVYWHSRDGHWVAGINVGKKRIEIGIFCTEIDAAMAYDEMALKHYGGFAKINGDSHRKA